MWQNADGEIDLILHWPTLNVIWAIEITRGKTKRLSTGFHAGCALTGATMLVVVHDEGVGVPDLKRAGTRGVIECLTLQQAMREARKAGGFTIG